MNFDAITPEMLEKAEACETPQEFMKLAQTSGIELTDADLDMIAGGVIDPETQKALEKLTPEQKAQVTDACSVFRLVNEPVALVPGSPGNIKITYKTDLEYI